MMIRSLLALTGRRPASVAAAVAAAAAEAAEAAEAADVKRAPRPSSNPSRGVFSTVWRILFGVVLGIFAAPVVKRYRRPVMAKVVRAGLVVGREVQETTARIREDIEDMAAEATHDAGPGAAPGGDGQVE